MLKATLMQCFGCVRNLSPRTECTCAETQIHESPSLLEALDGVEPLRSALVNLGHVTVFELAPKSSCFATYSQQAASTFSAKLLIHQTWNQIHVTEAINNALIIDPFPWPLTPEHVLFTSVTWRHVGGTTRGGATANGTVPLPLRRDTWSSERPMKTWHWQHILTHNTCTILNSNTNLWETRLDPGPGQWEGARSPNFNFEQLNSFEWRKRVHSVQTDEDFRDSFFFGGGGGGDYAIRVPRDKKKNIKIKTDGNY